MDIGVVIKKYRKEAGMTQEEMANRLGVTTPAVNKWEPGGQVKWLFYCPTSSPNILNRISHIISIFKNTLILNQSCIHHVCCIYPSYNPVLFQMLYKAIQITK